MSLLDTSTNKQLLHKSWKARNLMTRLFLHFWNVPATFSIRQKEPVSEICVVPFSNFGNWITFGPLRMRCLFYIWTTLLITVYTFAVVIISLHIRKYAILLHLTWLNSKKLAFTLFLPYSHKGWTAALAVFGLLSTTTMYVLGSCAGWKFLPAPAPHTSNPHPPRRQTRSYPQTTKNSQLGQVFVVIKSWEVCINFNKIFSKMLYLCTSILHESDLLKRFIYI